MAEPDPPRAPSRAFADAMAGADQLSRRATPAAAFARAREIVGAGDRLDMGALAADLGIARATLYRWTGDRDRLLADVFWADLKLLIEHFERAADDAGLARLQRICGQFLDALADNTTLRAFLGHEGAHGLRLVTALDGGVRPRIVAALAALIRREADAGAYRPPADADLLSDGIISLGERFLYHNGEPAMNPDPSTARLIIGLLLREAEPA